MRSIPPQALRWLLSKAMSLNTQNLKYATNIVLTSNIGKGLAVFLVVGGTDYALDRSWQKACIVGAVAFLTCWAVSAVNRYE